MSDSGTDGLEIRAPRIEEFHEIVELGNITFGEEATREDEAAFIRDFPFDRALCAYDAGRMVGSLAVFSMELTLPGRNTVPAGGATWGATLPTHRRRGILRSLFTAQMRDMMEREEPVSVLGASEATIYRRFGYGAASTIMSFSLDRAYAGLAPPAAGATPGEITLVAGVEAAGRLAGVFEALRRDQPGAVSRSPQWWSGYLSDPPLEREGATRMYHAVHSGRSGDDGYVSYRIKEQWAASTPMNEVVVVELLAGDRDAYRALWQYIIGTDLCQTISCGRARVDEPLRWLLADSRRLTVNAVSDDLYLRLLDVPRALMARAYSAPGEVVFEVVESFPAPRTGRYLLTTQAAAGGAGVGAAEAAGADCRPTDRQVDIFLDVATLGAAFLGGVSFTDLATAGRLDCADPRVLAAADAMFSTGIAPFCSTQF